MRNKCQLKLLNDLAKSNILIARCQNFSLFITCYSMIIITKYGVWALIFWNWKLSYFIIIIIASGARRVIASGRMLIEWLKNFFLFIKSLFGISFAVINIIINNKIGFYSSFPHILCSLETNNEKLNGSLIRLLIIIIIIIITICKFSLFFLFYVSWYLWLPIMTPFSHNTFMPNYFTPLA